MGEYQNSIKSGGKSKKGGVLWGVQKIFEIEKRNYRKLLKISFVETYIKNTTIQYIESVKTLICIQRQYSHAS